MRWLPDNKNKKSSTGQILIGILVAIAVFAILIHALFTLIASSFELVGFNRSRITARHLAQEKIERIRNLDYEDIGTVGGIPDGVLVQEETVRRNGLNFEINTDVVYVDDPFNGTGSPNDTDYKRARVEVSWEGVASSRVNPIILLTDIAPQTSSSSTGGTLRVLVFDANGEPVSEADVTIVASSVDPPVNTTQQTDVNGEVLLPGAEPCNECYEITVTKEDYSTDRTYSDSEVANPIKPHATVVAGDTTQVSFAIDVLGSLNIASVDSRENDFQSLSDVNFRLRGQKIIGTDTSGQEVYKYDQNITTDSTGNLTLPEIEWDIYHLVMPSGSTYDISGSTPLVPFSLSPGEEVSVTFANEAASDHRVLTRIKDTSQSLLEDVTVRVYDNNSYDEATTSGALTNPDAGQAFFPSLEEKTYHLEATASGYLDETMDIIVSDYSVQDVVMDPE